MSTLTRPEDHAECTDDPIRCLIVETRTLSGPQVMRAFDECRAYIVVRERLRVAEAERDEALNGVRALLAGLKGEPLREGASAGEAKLYGVGMAALTLKGERDAAALATEVAEAWVAYHDARTSDGRTGDVQETHQRLMHAEVAYRLAKARSK